MARVPTLHRIISESALESTISSILDCPQESADTSIAFVNENGEDGSPLSVVLFEAKTTVE